MKLLVVLGCVALCALAVAAPDRDQSRNEGTQSVKRRKKCPGCYTILSIKDRSAGDVSLPSQSLRKRDTEDAEKQHKQQKHFKGREKWRRGRKHGDIRPQEEGSEVMTEHKNLNERRRKKHRTGLYTALGSVPDFTDRRTEEDGLGIMREDRGHRGHHERHHKKHRSGLYPAPDSSPSFKSQRHWGSTEELDPETLGAGQGHRRHHGKHRHHKKQRLENTDPGPSAGDSSPRGDPQVTGSHVTAAQGAE